MPAHINRIATAVPPHDVHDAFVGFAAALLDGRRERALFDKLAARAQIAHRFSVLAPDFAAKVYARGGFPSLAERMRLYEAHAPELATHAARKLELGADAKRITHVVVTSCTGLYAPGLDLELVARLGLSPSVERTMVAFMGCYAAINALKLAHHIVRSEARARVLVVSLELCSLHMKDTTDLEEILSFLLFADGAAACVVSADPVGFAIDRFHAALIPDTHELITWRVGGEAFDMVLSGRVPGAIATGLAASAREILDGAAIDAFDLWAVHPGGRTILDAAQRGLGLAPPALAPSRRVLERYGNMSSATVLFVLRELAQSAGGTRGCALAFGPGLTAETMLFHRVSA